MLICAQLTVDAVPLQDDIKQTGIQVIDLIYKEDFKNAEETARRLVKKYPENPAGYFFVAATLDAWMAFYFDKKKENEFYKFCDLALEKGEKILAKNANDEWTLFFMGGAEGYKGTYEARYERWITAFRYGWRGVSTLLKLTEMKSDIVDVNYGVGSYDYWRSAMINTLWFMPKIKDKREDGIKRLTVAADSGVLTRLTAHTALIDILLNENRSSDAMTYTDRLISQYPMSTQSMWGKARSLYGLEQFDESRRYFTKVLNRYETDEYKSAYYPVLCHYWLARVNSADTKYADVIRDVTAMNAYTLTDDIRKLLAKYF
ncbi:MAG TPA: tetratricopeptide repeat protein, partial [Chitinispirillaceae bacterium]|nr:tetratricopeptide repeat protein [Chitinispirillaceae bacterium]